MIERKIFPLNTTFRLKPLDVAFMKAIHNKVNIVPVIAKADTLTLKERERLKKRVRAGLLGGGHGRGGEGPPSRPPWCWCCQHQHISVSHRRVSLGGNRCALYFERACVFLKHSW